MQQKRRKKRNRHLPERQDDLFQLIDDNWSHYPAAYCTHYCGYLTIGLIETHRCDKQNCPSFRIGVDAK